MELNVGILIAQWINFLVLLFVFKKFLGKPLTEALVQRREELAKAEDATKVYEDTMLKAEEEKKALLNEALEHKQQLAEEAKASAQKQADTILKDAEKNAEKLLKSAEEKAQKLSQDVEENFVEWVKSTAKVIVNKLFEKDVSLQEQYLDELVNEYARSAS